MSPRIVIGVAAAAVAGLAAIGVAARPAIGDLPAEQVGPADAVIRGIADRIRSSAPRRGVVLIGEDHRSPVPDAVVAELLEGGGFDCLFLELDSDLQPSVDAFAAGRNWERTVRADLERRFGGSMPSRGQDRLALRAARRLGVALHAVDHVPRDVLRAATHAASLGAPPSPALRDAMIATRDAEMAERIAARIDDGRCRVGVYTVGWNHIPGLGAALDARGVRAWSMVIEHREPPPLAPIVDVRWVGGVAHVR